MMGVAFHDMLARDVYVFPETFWGYERIDTQIKER
jgi:hypothetical protein